MKGCCKVSNKIPLHELRFKIGRRIYYAILNKKFVALFGGKKNDQKKDIKKAYRILEREIQKPLRTDYKPGTDVSLEGLKLAIIEALDERDPDTFRGSVSMLLEKVKMIRKTSFKNTLYIVSKPDTKITKFDQGFLLGKLSEMCDPRSYPTSSKQKEKVKEFISQLEEKQEEAA